MIVAFHYHPRMRIGNNFSWVCLCLYICLCVSLSFCLSFCQSVQAITFKPLNVEPLFLVHISISTISRSSLNINVIGSKSRSNKKNHISHNQTVGLYSTKVYSNDKVVCRSVSLNVKVISTLNAQYVHLFKTFF